MEQESYSLRSTHSIFRSQDTVRLSELLSYWIFYFKDYGFAVDDNKYSLV